MPFSNLLIVYLYSYIPALLLVGFFWWMDRFERESILVVLFAFLWGAFGAGLLSYFWNTFFHIVLDLYQRDASLANDMVTSVLIAPFIEELTKGIMILIFLWLGKVDNVMDGILMGIVIGLGFAASENVHYAEEVIFPSMGELAMWYNLHFREVHTTLLHACATAVWGAMIGYAHYQRGFNRYFAIFNGFILAMVTHGFWNFLASYVGSIDAGVNIIRWVMRLELFLIFGMLLTLFLLSVRNQSQTIVKEMLDEVDRGIIPLAHVGFFASLVRHSRRYDLPQKTKPNDYAKLGVTLALKKFTHEHNPTSKLLHEIENLRGKLKLASEFTPDSLSLRYGRDLAKSK